ncbi:hypothetical protein INT43_000074 [Umbelopsis isabellina]|uniref:Phosphatidylethanolamine-binding protein n=1 Tax=Mortierella isabellina TaxID=91625 RepID=A0A8H7PF07_MORIS|nr:hypothetical protein INT43_000074 [Umbelopsis isabellina]
MPSFGQRFEAFLGNLLSSQKGRDAGLFSTQPAFKDKEPTITINSVIGPSGSTMTKEYAADGEDKFPDLSWDAVPNTAGYVLVIEDPDAPLWFPPIHGLFYDLAPDNTTVKQSDLEAADTKKKTLKSGAYKYGKNIRGNVYGGPKPVLNHGNHRYFYQLVALKRPMKNLSAFATREEILNDLADDNILAWGVWLGNYERKLE